MNCLQCVSEKEKYGIYARNNSHLFEEIDTLVFSWRKGSKSRPQSNSTFIKKCSFYIETKRKSMTVLENGWIFSWFTSTLSSFMLVNWMFSMKLC